MPRDLTPPPERTAEELDRAATITEADLLHAEETAKQLATPKLQEMLDATKMEDDER